MGGRGREGEEGRPDLSTTNTGASVVRSLTLSRLTEAKKRQSIYKCTQKCVIYTAPKDTKPEFLEHGWVVFHIALEFSDCDEPFVLQIERKRQNRPARGQPALAWDGDKVDCVRQWGRGTRAAVTQRARIKCVALDKPSDARLRNQARV